MQYISQVRTTRTEYVDGTPSGVRRARSSVSNLRVAAGPFAARDRVLAETDQAEFMAYVLKGDVVYVGHGCADRRRGDRLNSEQSVAIQQIYLVHSIDGTFGKHAARLVECWLWKLARENGVPLANRAAPNGVTTDELNSAEALELVREVRLLLMTAGCSVFEEKVALRPADPVLGPTGVTVLEQLPSDAEPTWSLDFPGLHAVGLDQGDGFIILPGAQFCLDDKKGLDHHNRQRREYVRAALNLGGATLDGGQARLSFALFCGSRAIAAKLLTGRHIGGQVWKRLERAEQLRFGFALAAEINEAPAAADDQVDAQHAC